MHFFLNYLHLFFLFHTIGPNGGNVDLGKLLNKKKNVCSEKKKVVFIQVYFLFELDRVCLMQRLRSTQLYSGQVVLANKKTNQTHIFI